MSTTAKTDPEALALRASPRRVVRFKRGLLIGAAAIASVAVLAVTVLALQGNALHPRPRSEDLFAAARSAPPDGLAALPGDYGQMKPATPVLGPPLPGDLGRPILEHQRQLGLAPGGGDRAVEAERQRLASQAVQARESTVFFRIAARPAMPADVSKRAGVAPAADTGAPNTNRLALDPARDQNNQQRKLDFMKERGEGGILNPHALQTPVSPYEVIAGSVIAASLITGIKSDLPGLVVAQVTENVYDTVTGRTLLIPQGARLMGTYDSVVAYGQSRALVVWGRIILPDGSSIQIDNLPATDPAGYAGLEDGVDYHTWTLLKGIAMSTLLGVGTGVTFGSNQSNLVEAIRQSTQESANQAGQRIVEKNLNIQPSLTIRPGMPLRIIVHKDLVLRPYQG